MNLVSSAGQRGMVFVSAIAISCAAFAGGDPACPGEGSCCKAHPSPGCDDEACCELVCARDPFCCDTEWDEPCAATALLACGLCVGEDCNGNGIPDDKDIAMGFSPDCNANGIPDECDVDPTDPDGDGNVSADCNGNGIPDECDVDPADPDGNGLVSADCDHDGVPDECEFCPWDLDTDGNVGTADLLTTLGGWGTCPASPKPCPADFDCGGSVGTVDLLALLGKWGPCECVPPAGVSSPLFCDAEYRAILANITPLLQPALCVALDAIGQSDRCPDPNDEFYVEMDFSTPTLKHELLDGGPSIGIRVDLEAQTMDILVVGEPIVTIPIDFPLTYRLSSLMNVVTTLQTATKWLKVITVLSNPCVMWAILDTMGDIYGKDFVGALLACELLVCFAADLLVGNEFYEDLLLVFAVFKCGFIVDNLHTLFNQNERDIVAGTLYQVRDNLGLAACGVVCDCNALPCSP